MKNCAYCGKDISKGEREHVFPRCLYPDSKSISKTQRITVLSCTECNNGFADDEAHFRNVLTLAGKPNAARKEIWDEKVEPSFSHIDGKRRIADLISLMKPVKIQSTDRQLIFPGKDPRVSRIIKKIIRGLSHYHNIETAVPEERVWCDILKFDVPKDILSQMAQEHRESDVISYQFEVINDGGISSGWILTFYEVIIFIGMVTSNNSFMLTNH
jgi:hypothetical protein